MHPIGTSPGIRAGDSNPLNCAILLMKWEKSDVPFFIPKASHAAFAGKIEEWRKNPPPPILLIGDFSRNRNKSPGPTWLNGVLPPGLQKLTSSMPG